MRIIVISPHGDDSTLHAGGWIAQRARAGDEVTILRVTNDEKDSFSGDIAGTVRANREEADEAARILGATRFVSFDYRDCEMDPLDETEMRGRMVRLFRELKPDLVMGYDPWGPYEENPDHLKCARAMDDACWSSNHPHFYPEQLRAGLERHCIVRRAYFSRAMHAVNRVTDIGDVMDLKIRAMQAHRTMSLSMLTNFREQVAAAKITLPALQRITDAAEFAAETIRARARRVGAMHGVEYAEVFRFAEFDATNPLVAHFAALG